jgi:predicted nucleic acid-binding protein
MAMTAVADTRLLLTIQFPADELVRERIRIFIQREMVRGIILPSIVLSEFIKIAGLRIGIQAALTTINALKERGMRTKPIDEDLAKEAGRLLLKHSTVPFADSLIAAFTTSGIAEYILSDDPHFTMLGSKTRWF